MQRPAFVEKRNPGGKIQGMRRLRFTFADGNRSRGALRIVWSRTQRRGHATRGRNVEESEKILLRLLQIVFSHKRDTSNPSQRSAARRQCSADDREASCTEERNVAF